MCVVSAEREADQRLQLIERRCRVGHLDGPHTHLPGGLEVDPKVVEVDAALRITPFRVLGRDHVSACDCGLERERCYSELCPRAFRAARPGERDGTGCAGARASERV